MTDAGSRGPGRPPGSDGLVARRLLLDAARRLFAAQGYAATTTRQIADAAGMQPGNLRHHLGAKSAVFGAVGDDCMQRIGDVVVALLASDPPPSPGGYVRLLGRMLAQEPEVMAFLAIAPLERRRHPELQGPLGPAPTELEAVVRNAVQEWHRAGRVAADQDPDVVVDAVIAAVYGLLVYTVCVDPTLDRSATVETFARLVDGDLWA